MTLANASTCLKLLQISRQSDQIHKHQVLLKVRPTLDLHSRVRKIVSREKKDYTKDRKVRQQTKMPVYLSIVIHLQNILLQRLIQMKRINRLLAER